MRDRRTGTEGQMERWTGELIDRQTEEQTDRGNEEQMSRLTDRGAEGMRE
jgi:hypothetical protein